MLAVQHRLPLAPSRVRSVRRAFHPSQGEGPYRLPNGVRDRLEAALAPFRNRTAAYALAVFLARHHSGPRNMGRAYPIDRRALANRPDLELTEDRVRGALKTLEAIGFLDRVVAAPGSRYRLTEEGLKRKAVLFAFGGEFLPLFQQAHKRAGAAAGRVSGSRRPQPPAARENASTAVLAAKNFKYPKDTPQAESVLLMGGLRKEIGIPPIALELDPGLAAALDRLEEGFRQGRGGFGKGGVS